MHSAAKEMKKRHTKVIGDHWVYSWKVSDKVCCSFLTRTSTLEPAHTYRILHLHSDAFTLQKSENWGIYSFKLRSCTQHKDLFMKRKKERKGTWEQVSFSLHHENNKQLKELHELLHGDENKGIQISLSIKLKYITASSSSFHQEPDTQTL